MTVEIKVPDLPESVADATVGNWHKSVGEAIKAGELLVEIETDKVVLEVPAPEDGILSEISQERGATVTARQLLGSLQPAPVAGEATAQRPEAVPEVDEAHKDAHILTPSVRRLMAENDIDEGSLEGIERSGRGGRLTREDLQRHLEQPPVVEPEAQPESLAPPQAEPESQPAVASKPEAAGGEREERRVPMSRLRKRIAERLLEAKNTTAMLTTFNEVNMQPVMNLRQQYQELFQKRHGIKLGFMSFYVKAVTEALKRYPEINASVDRDDIIYHNYFDISIAVAAERGLVTPVLRDCERMSFADIEKGIKELADKARDGKLTMDELTGGNFTITNGGIFGSLMSTPIINPPQSAILGMHKIQDRPMAVDGKVEILPMMYLALSYDHRIIDGREAVGFLVAIKEMLEEPTRLLLDI